MRIRIIIALLTGFFQLSAVAADVEPRLYSNIPTGVNFFAIAYGRSSGEVTFDSSLPVEDVEGEIDGVILSYSRGLNIAGKSALLTVSVPYVNLDLEGLLLGEPASGSVKGFGDPQARLSINFFGAPALTPGEFRAYQQKTIAGASISVGMPFGQYDGDKLVNIGTNRWSFIGQMGISHKISRWTFESAVGVSWVTDNDDLKEDRTLEQDPIGLFRGTVFYTFPSGLWIGSGFVYSSGGQSTIDGVERNDRQKSWRGGMAISIPIIPRHQVQFRVTEGITARIGSDFLTFTAAYSYTF